MDGDARVADEDVQAAEGLDDLIDHRPDLVLAADIDPHRPGSARRVGGYLVDGRAVLVIVGEQADGGIGTRAGQRSRYGLADAAVPATSAIWTLESEQIVD